MQNFAPQFSKNHQGFTLLEVLVSTAILALASIGIYYVILSSFEINREISGETDLMLTIAIATDSVDRDISQMYSPVMGKTTPPLDNNPRDFWSAKQRSDGLRRSRFTGKRDKITFVSNSNRRLVVDSKQSTLHRITYEIEQDKDGRYKLMKSVDFNVFDYEGEVRSSNRLRKFPVMENLEKAKFEFYRSDKERWEDSWDSEGAYTEDHSRYPDIIAFEFTIVDPNDEKSARDWRSEFAPTLSLNLPQKDQPGSTLRR